MRKTVKDETAHITDTVKTSDTLSEVDSLKEEDPKKLYAEGHHAKAKDVWVRQCKSCDYVLNRCAIVDTPEKETIPREKFLEFQEIRHKALLNLTLVSLKLRDWGDCVNYADLILEYEPGNEKAIYRKAKALYEMGKSQEAQAMCEKYAGQYDVAVEKLRGEIETTLRRRKNVERQMAASLITGGPEKSQWGSRAMIAIGSSVILAGLIGLAYHYRNRR